MHQDLRFICRGCRAVSGGRLLGCMHCGEQHEKEFYSRESLQPAHLAQLTVRDCLYLSMLIPAHKGGRSVVRKSQSIMRKLASGTERRWTECLIIEHVQIHGDLPSFPHFPIWAAILLSVFLIPLTGLFAGLTIGLLSLDNVGLRVRLSQHPGQSSDGLQ